MLADLREWGDLADLIEANCTIRFKVPNGTVTYNEFTGNSEFSQREITVRAYVFEDNTRANRAPQNMSIGVDDLAKELVGVVQSVSDLENPNLPNHLLPPLVADLSTCRMEYDSPTGLKRTGEGIIRLKELDNYSIHETLGEMFFIRFTPDKFRST
jgi:hypothetical protein